MQLVGDDGANTPPAHALADAASSTTWSATRSTATTRAESAGAHRRRGRARRRRRRGGLGAARRLFRAAATAPLDVTPVAGRGPTLPMPFAFDIAVGMCAAANSTLRDEIDGVLERRRRARDRQDASTSTVCRAPTSRWTMTSSSCPAPCCCARCSLAPRCKREERDASESPPASHAASDVGLSDLHPGERQPAERCDHVRTRRTPTRSPKASGCSR